MIKLEFNAIFIISSSEMPGESSWILFTLNPFSRKMIVLGRGKFSLAKNIVMLKLGNKVPVECSLSDKQIQPSKIRLKQKGRTQ